MVTLEETHLLVRALLVWASALTVVVVLLVLWATQVEERVRRRFGEDLQKALESERILK